MFPPSTNLPPCMIPPHFLFGHIPHVFANDPDGDKFRSIFVDQANEAGISTFWFGNKPCVSVLKAEHVRTCFRNSIERPGNTSFAKHFKKCIGEESILMMEGGKMDREKWRHHRNLIKSGFTKKSVDNMANKVWEMANNIASSILRECAKNNSDANQGDNNTYRADGEDIFKWVTLDVFGKVALNYSFGCTDTLSTTPLAHSLNYTVEDSSARMKVANLLNPLFQFYWFPTRRNRDYKYHSQNVHGLIREICRQRVKEIEDQNNGLGGSSNDGAGDADHGVSKNGDLLTSLLKSKMQSQDTKLDDDSHGETIQMLMTLFFAGYDTSSILLSMAMWSIATNPAIQQECSEEAKRASSTISSSPPLNNCSVEQKKSLHEDSSQWESRLAYCQAVILETSRLHPPVYSNCRAFDKDVKMDGSTIPRRTRVYLPIALIHADERNFARPTEFLPERWVRRDPITREWIPRDYETEEPKQFVDDDPTYLPPGNPRNLFIFSDGARKCPGYRLALQESTVIFACIVRDLTVDVREGFVMQKRKKFALAPPVEMPLIFRKRE
mmetsp:Transcript_39646/g.82821  ORF Transcript_39646/g.82821 Transcript_39646/m.82821 type:complete len:554 (+) Transcript_39646:1-1662(+)